MGPDALALELSMIPMILLIITCLHNIGNIHMITRFQI